MYRDSNTYENIAKLVIDICIDYEIKSLPVDEKELCQRMGIKLLAYSDFPISVFKISDDAFFVPMEKNRPPIIAYNDTINSSGRKRFSIFHEIKHFVCCDTEENPHEEDMANYFAKYIMCPIPWLIYLGVDDAATIMADCNVSYEVATFVLRNLQNRRLRHQNKIFAHEQPLIDLLIGGGCIESKRKRI